MTCWVICRVSTQGQTEKEGPAVQEERGRRFFGEHPDFKGCPIQVRHEVESGRKESLEDRPKLKAVLNEIQFNDAVYWDDEDRMARDNGVKKEIIKQLRKKNVRLFIRTQEFDLFNPQQMLQLGLKGEFDEYMGAWIVQRMAGGKLRAWKKGRWLTWNPPFGYRRDENKQLVIDPDEQAVYDKMVRWVLEEKVGCHTVAHRLNLLGIPGRYLRYGKSVQGKTAGFHWGYGTIHRILTNPIYAGAFQFQDTVIQVPPLSSPERWQTVQDQLTENWRHRPLRKTKSRYLLQGLLFCGRCGRRMYGQTKTHFRCPRKACRHRLNAELLDGRLPDRCGKCRQLLSGKCWSNVSRLYRCWTKNNREVPWEEGRCSMPSIRIDELEQRVWEHVRTLAKDATKLRSEMKAAQAKAYVDDVELRGQLADIEKVIAEKDRRIDALLDSRDLVVRREYVMRNVERLHGEKEQLASERDRLTRQLAQLERAKQNRALLEQAWTQIGERIDKLTDQGRFDFLHLATSQVIVDYDKTQDAHLLRFKLRAELLGEIPQSLQPLSA